MRVKGGILTKRSGAYKSEKRKKELMRQKKQEMKRQRRLGKGGAAREESEAPVAENPDVKGQ